MAEMVAKLEDVLHRLFGNVRNQERVGVGSFKLSLPSQTLNSNVKEIHQGNLFEKYKKLTQVYIAVVVDFEQKF